LKVRISEIPRRPIHNYESFTNSIFYLLVLFVILYGFLTFSINYRLVADDYAQILIASEKSISEYANWVRFNIDPSPLGFIFYTIVFKIMIKVNLGIIWVIVLLSILATVTFASWVIATILDVKRNLKVIVSGSIIILLIMSAGGTESVTIKSAITLTWLSSFYLHTINYFALIYLILSISMPANGQAKIAPLISALVCAASGGINPITASLTYFVILITFPTKTNVLGQLKRRLRATWLQLLILFAGSFWTYASQGFQNRKATQVLQIENTGDFTDRFIGALALAFRENILSNFSSFLMIFIFAIAVGNTYTGVMLARLNTPIFQLFGYGVLIHTIVYCLIEAMSYFGYWHHGNNSISLGFLVFIIGLRVASRLDTFRSPFVHAFQMFVKIFFLSAFLLILNNSNYFLSKASQSWDKVQNYNLSVCQSSRFVPPFQFSRFLEGPTSDWNNFICDAHLGTDSFSVFEINSGIRRSFIDDIQINLILQYDRLLLAQAKSDSQIQGLKRQLY